MRLLKRWSAIMESPWAYALWQAPFANAKFAPIQRHNDLGSVHRVLDVGCGPGTNTKFFAHTDYVGIDINESYVERGRRRFGRTFIQADVCDYTPAPDQRYDFVLINSLMHHLDDVTSDRILNTLRRVITPDGHLHVLDLILPDDPSIARYLAENDRGNYPRPFETWNELLVRYFEPVVVERFSLGLMGLDLWRMLYFKGRPRAG